MGRKQPPRPTGPPPSSSSRDGEESTRTDSMPFDPARVPDAPGADSIPGYRLLRVLGTGGMGVVYEAEQEQPRRKVAIKVLSVGGRLDDLRLRLFQREIQALARLEHPGIGAIHAAGLTRSGSPYFSMELVEGIPLSEHVGSSPLPRTRRELHAALQLFLRICDAVAYAHQRAVVHRDLKPSNILLAGARPGSRDEALVPKVVDFGLARITDEESDLTLQGEVRGTLGYMSPEQATGSDGGLRLQSDVYSLGVLLFELLTRRRPIETRDLTVPEALRRIAREPPMKPREASPLLRGELEVILLKALEKDPDRRYATAGTFAEDVRRYLANQPILARPPSTAYQIRKLIERHRAWFAASAGLLVLLVTFGITMTVMYDLQRQAKARAQQESRKTRETLMFLRDMLGSVAPVRSGPGVTVRQVLDVAARDLASGRLQMEPEVRAEVAGTIGSAYAALGLYRDAESHLRTSLALRGETLGPDHPHTASSARVLAATLFEAGGNLEEAAALAERALAAHSREPGPRDAETASDLNLLGRIEHARGRSARSDSLLHRALSVRREVLGPDHPEVAETLSNLAALRYSLGRPVEARESLDAAVGIWREASPGYELHRALGLMNLGSLFLDAGHPARAESLFTESLAVLESRIGGSAHPSLAVALNNLSLSLLYQGRVSEAESPARRCLAMARELTGGSSPLVASAVGTLAFLEQTRGAYAEAESLYRDALSIQESLEETEFRGRSAATQNLARILHVRGRYAEAESLLRIVLAARRETLGSDHPETIDAQIALGALLLDRGDLESAEAMLRPCVAFDWGPETWRPALARNTLAVCLARRGSWAAAESLFASSRSELLRGTGAPAWKRQPLQRTIAVLVEAGRAEDAAPYRDALTRAMPGSTQRSFQ